EVRGRAAELIRELGPDAGGGVEGVRKALVRSVEAGAPEPGLVRAFAALGPRAVAAAFEVLERVPVGSLKPDHWALEVLRRTDIASLTPLMASLEHPAASVRVGGLEGLTALGDRARAAAKKLPGVLEDREGEVRVRAWVAAGACGVAPELLMGRLEAGLNDPVPAVRRAVVMGLARLGKLAKPAVPKLMEAMGSGDAELERASIRALGAMGSEAAVAAGALVAKAGSVAPEVQVEVLSTLGAIGSAAAAEMGPLWGLGDASHRGVRLAFLDAVASFQAAGKPALPSVDRGLADADPDVRAAAVRARIAVDEGSEESVQAAVRALEDADGRVRRAAAAALGRLEERGRPGEARLFALLADPSDRTSARDALRAIHPTSVSALLSALEHDDWGVREMAADALARLGKRAEEALGALEKRSREDRYEEVKRAARRALRRIREG
ncbi:MAG: HEAT repeat domain-containing protein, partial [Verrucomicrobiales bacterium]|nr:HEAT repeat domain-containing protein [Verrucomicrobiales bacterium]